VAMTIMSGVMTTTGTITSMTMITTMSMPMMTTGTTMSTVMGRPMTTSTVMGRPMTVGITTIAEAGALAPDCGEASVSLSDEAVLKLGIWLSPAFPVGGFTYSHGLEWAIEDGSVTTAAALEAWLGDILVHGAGRNDGILFAHGWRAVRAGDWPALADIVELADALQPSRERRLEAGAQGAAFAKAIGDTWDNAPYRAAIAALASRLP